MIACDAKSLIKLSTLSKMSIGDAQLILAYNSWQTVEKKSHVFITKCIVGLTYCSYWWSFQLTAVIMKVAQQLTFTVPYRDFSCTYI